MQDMILGSSPSFIPAFLLLRTLPHSCNAMLCTSIKNPDHQSRKPSWVCTEPAKSFKKEFSNDFFDFLDRETTVNRLFSAFFSPEVMQEVHISRNQRNLGLVNLSLCLGQTGTTWKKKDADRQPPSTCLTITQDGQTPN
uniref:Uncharacterized protein n=1 Tax=Opuntia streptacantha TaxID=393608 RepID=A0A7C9ADP2_OPUST